jgi:hypothetical protein
VGVVTVRALVETFLETSAGAGAVRGAELLEEGLRGGSALEGGA